jgi:hypothetical protein
MFNKVVRNLLILPILLLPLCGGKEIITQSGVNVENQTIALAFTLPCSQGSVSAQDSLSEAVATITASDIDTIISNLTVEPCKITGFVKNIPAGIERCLDLRVFNSRKQLVYFGTATFDVQPGKSIDVVLKLQPNTGAVNIIGVICDTVINNPTEFRLDSNAIALYHFNETTGNVLIDETGKWNGTVLGAKRVKGYSGNALQFNYGDVAKFDTIIQTNTTAGTLELFLMFDDSVKKDSIYSVFGNDGCRCNIFYKNGYLIFTKNHNDIYKQVQAKFTMKSNTWYHIAGTWGKQGMGLFVDDSLLARNQDVTAYQSSYRSTVENQFNVGAKTYMGMVAIGISRDLSFEGYLDEIRVSNIERY